MRGVTTALGCIVLLAAAVAASGGSASQSPSVGRSSPTPPEQPLAKAPKAQTATPAGEEPPESEAFSRIRGRNLAETFSRGGPLMYPILLCSLVGLAFAIERLVSLRRSVVAPRGLAEGVLGAVGERDMAKGLRLCEGRPSSLARVLKVGLALGGSPREEIVTAMQEAGERELWSLERFAKPLSIIAGVAPLLGLLGTVWGMIMAFDVVAAKGALGDPRQLAEGIATALLTTFAGLTVAIPCFVFYHYFRSKSDRLVAEIEETATHMAAALHEAPSHANPAPPRGGGGAASDAAH